MFTIYGADCRGNMANCLYPNEAQVHTPEDLKAISTYDFVCAKYKGSYRSENNFIESNCLPVDCDNDHSDDPAKWVTPETVARAFPDTAFAVHYSRHHNLPKDGRPPRPRFHVLFPIEPVRDPQVYKNMKTEVQNHFPYFDPKALDAARFFFGTSDSKIDWHEGDLNLSEFFYFNQDRPQTIRQGGRNNALSQFAARVLKRYGIAGASRKAFVQEAKKCDPPLEHEELQAIWRSAVKFYRQKVAANPGYIPPEEYEGRQDGDALPEPVVLSSVTDPPVKPPELIHGILRQGHKMLVAGPSKAGKSFLLMELAIAVAEGKPWLGFGCRQGKVLYINLEIDPSSCLDRFLKIYDALGYAQRHSENILVWNLRGYAKPLNQLAPILIDKMIDENIAAVIVDPIYKVITGDENNASEMGAFCNQFDAICTALGASVIYCHHHSKGAQGHKRAMDRASGSGVFARDPDALLDIIALKKPASIKELEEEGEEFEEDLSRTPWQMEASLREFPPVKNIRFFFEHPIHRIDSEGLLSSYHAEGSGSANLSASSKRTSSLLRKKRLDTAFEQLSEEGVVTVAKISAFTGLSVRTIRDYIKEFPDDYTNTNGVVTETPILRKKS